MIFTVTDPCGVVKVRVFPLILLRVPKVPRPPPPLGVLGLAPLVGLGLPLGLGLVPAGEVGKPWF